jgi:hypothetical protein
MNIAALAHRFEGNIARKAARIAQDIRAAKGQSKHGA